MGFAEGFRTGSGVVQQVIENQRQARLDERADEEYARKKKLEGEEDTAWANYQKVAKGGLQPEMVGGIKSTYGMNDQQIAAAGSGLRDKLASYDQPDSYDLQGPAPALTGAVPGGAPAAGAQPRFNADRIPTGPNFTDRVAVERALGGVAAAKRDVQGLRASQDAEQKLEMREAYNVVGKMTEQAKRDRISRLNTNMSEIGLLSLGPAGKNGYRFLQIDPATGKEGKEFTLNAVQRDKLLVADALRDKGYGPEAMELASSVSNHVAEAIKAQNETVGKVATQNATVTHQGRVEDLGAERNRIAAGGLKVQQDRAKEIAARERAGDFNPIGISPDGKSIVVWDTKFNRQANVPVAEGMDPKEQFKMMRAAQSTGSGKGTADKVAPEPGSIMQRGDKTNYKVGGVDPKTGLPLELGTRAVMPEARTQTLQKAGLPPDIAEQLEWTDAGPGAGEHVVYRGIFYSALTPDDPDLKKLKAQIVQDREHESALGEVGHRYRRDRAEFENPDLASARKQDQPHAGGLTLWR